MPFRLLKFALSKQYPEPRMFRRPERLKDRYDAVIIGAGGHGLAAAYHLTLLGHAVTVRDAGDQAGGMMRFGIPKYRLPRDVLDAEVQRIVDFGVKLELGARVDDILEAMRSDAFDAAFLAVGAHIGKRAYIPAATSARILDAVSVLRSMEGEAPPRLGRRGAVYGRRHTQPPAAPPAQRVGAAAVGMQVVGLVPFASTFAAFFTRAYDFIRMAAVSRANIRLSGSHAGVSIGEDGPAQMALDDLAMMRRVQRSCEGAQPMAQHAVNQVLGERPRQHAEDDQDRVLKHTNRC